MAVAPPETPALEKHQLVKDFWPRFNRIAIFLIIIIQLIILTAIAVMFYVFDLYSEDPLAVAGTLLAQSILGVVASIVLYRFVAQPIKQLLAALIHVAGEPTTTTPPNPNETHFEKNGFKAVLQTVYKLAAATPDPITPNAPAAAEASTRSIIEKALDETLCGFVVMNPQRQIVYANKATPVGIDRNGVQSLELLFADDDTLDKWWDQCTQSAVHAEHTWSRISNKLPNEEDRRFFDVIASYNKGTDSEVVLTLIDRTKLYSVGEDELDFIAFAAHELRGPITIIRGYLDVLQDELSGTLQDDQKELFHRLTVSANRLSGYINNILNTSRFDRRHLTMHLAETTVANVYDTIRDDIALRASSQNRLLSVTIPDGLPTIAADTASLGEVLVNLIDNAIKYSNEGGAITVTASSKGDMVEVAVQDNGIGMPSSVVSNLFQKFYRSHRSREAVSGTGIGLYITKAIIESHGGTISVRSEEGKGSTFVVSLPTYQSVAEKLRAGDNKNDAVMIQSGAYIKNHAAYRG